MEVGEDGMIIRCRRLLLAVPPVDQRVLFRCGGLFQTCRGTIDTRAPRITDALH